MFHGVLKEPSKNEEGRQDNIKKATKVMVDEKNPCLKEQNQSFHCLTENNYNRNACAGYFENYKRCKDFWNEVRVTRRREGIQPNLPPAEEREQIKRDLLNKSRSGTL